MNNDLSEVKRRADRALAPAQEVKRLADGGPARDAGAEPSAKAGKKTKRETDTKRRVIGPGLRQHPGAAEMSPAALRQWMGTKEAFDSWVRGEESARWARAVKMLKQMLGGVNSAQNRFAI
jgi:hypothetical protein